MEMNLYVEYWEDVLLHLWKPLLAQRSTLLEGFWTSSNYKLNYVRVELPSTKLIIDLKDPNIHPYFGPKNLKLVLHTPHLKISTMKILFLWSLMIFSLSLFGLEEHRMMLWRMIKMNSSKWWGFTSGFQWKKGSNLDEWRLYEDCWNSKWKCNLANVEQWFKISVLFSFPSWKIITNKSQITIPNSCSSWKKMNIEVANAYNNLWNILVMLIKYFFFFYVFFFI
jgi:hypothetical protein